MACYVDDVELAFGRMKMCHLWADTLPELFAMVDRIGVDRKWIQGHPTLSFGKHRNASWVHFDIAKSKRAQAILAGAVLTDRYGQFEHVARLMLASDDPIRRALGQNRLDTITICRGRRSSNAQEATLL